MAGSITSIISSGFDAFTNLYDVLIYFPNSGGTSDDMSLRVRALDFTPPELSRGQYEAAYKIASLPRLNAKIEGSREVSLTFRVDAAYNLHGRFLQWKHMWTDPSGDGNLMFQPNTSLEDGDAIINGYGKIVVQTYNSTIDASTISDPFKVDAADIAEKWEFFDVICTKAGSPALSREGSNAVTISPSFIFGRMKEPNSSLGDALGTPTIDPTSSFNPI